VVAQQLASPPARRLRQPSWLDLRLLIGMLLVLVSVLLGAKVVATADRSVQVWALARDVSAGTTLAIADLRPARVRLFDTAETYLRVAQSPAGRTVTRALHTGELLPRSAVVATPPGAIVSIPVQPGNAPDLARGQLVDVWSTAKGCAPVQVLSRVPVQEVHNAGGNALAVSAAATQVVVRVALADARRVVAALGTETTIRLVVLYGDVPKVPAATGSVETCAPVGASSASHQPAPAGPPAAAPTTAAPTTAVPTTAVPTTAVPTTAVPTTARTTTAAPAGQPPAPPSATPTDGGR
jgi:hypothetical protein